MGPRSGRRLVGLGMVAVAAVVLGMVVVVEEVLGMVVLGLVGQGRSCKSSGR